MAFDPASINSSARAARVRGSGKFQPQRPRHEKIYRQKVGRYPEGRNGGCCATSSSGYTGSPDLRDLERRRQPGRRHLEDERALRDARRHESETGRGRVQRSLCARAVENHDRGLDPRQHADQEQVREARGHRQDAEAALHGRGVLVELRHRDPGEPGSYPDHGQALASRRPLARRIL